MRLIDADALKKDLTRFYDGEVVARKLIDEQQTVDAVPVRRGRWKCADDLYENAVCSVCGWETSDPWTVIKILYKFCPNCGADMRKDGDGNG